MWWFEFLTAVVWCHLFCITEFHSGTFLSKSFCMFFVWSFVVITALVKEVLPLRLHRKGLLIMWKLSDATTCPHTVAELQCVMEDHCAPVDVVLWSPQGTFDQCFNSKGLCDLIGTESPCLHCTAPCSGALCVWKLNKDGEELCYYGLLLQPAPNRTVISNRIRIRVFHTIQNINRNAFLLFVWK